MARDYIPYSGPVITRKEALGRGLTQYFTGRPCGRGHIAPRSAKPTRYGNCIECERIRELDKRRQLRENRRDALQALFPDRRIVTRQEAIGLGIRTYFTGEPCIRGHISDRYSDNCNCCQCHLILASSDEQREKRDAHIKRWRKLSPRSSLQNNLKNLLRRTPTETPVTPAKLMELWHKQNGLCALSSIEMTWGSGHGIARPTSISIDRIDQTRGYELDNVRLVCYAVNCFRGRMSDKEMYEMARALYNTYRNELRRAGGEHKRKLLTYPKDVRTNA